MDGIDYVKMHVSREDRLCQLAEECAELSQAALKLARKLKNTNPTPKRLEDCTEAFKQECADVFLCIMSLTDVAAVTSIDVIAAVKLARWVNRIIENDMYNYTEGKGIYEDYKTKS